ncbi:MAG: SixA phosphatase family protein [Hyphomicrobiales bacterium]
MRRLYLLRHAKSARPAGVADHERPLAPRGLDDARAIGSYLKQEMLLPDLVLVSTATRTRQTWDIVIQGLGVVPSVHFEPGLYDAPAARLSTAVAQTPDGIKSLLLIGHNPGIADLALRLAGHGDRYALARMRAKFPTCALAVIDFPGDHWRVLAAGSARLDRFVTPKSLGAGADD